MFVGIVDIQWMGWYVFCIGIGVLFVEYVIGGEVDQGSFQLCGFLCQEGGCVGVDVMCQLRFGFGFDYCCIGGWVDDQIGLGFVYCCVQCICVGEVELFVYGCDYIKVGWYGMQVVQEFIVDLVVVVGEQDVYGFYGLGFEVVWIVLLLVL